MISNKIFPKYSNVGRIPTWVDLAILQKKIGQYRQANHNLLVHFTSKQ